MGVIPLPHPPPPIVVGEPRPGPESEPSPAAEARAPMQGVYQAIALPPEEFAWVGNLLGADLEEAMSDFENE